MAAGLLLQVFGKRCANHSDGGRVQRKFTGFRPNTVGAEKFFVCFRLQFTLLMGFPLATMVTWTLTVLSGSTLGSDIGKAAPRASKLSRRPSTEMGKVTLSIALSRSAGPWTLILLGVTTISFTSKVGAGFPSICGSTKTSRCD